MEAKGSYALAAVLVGLGWALVAGPASAGSEAAMLDSEMRKACSEQGGRYEQSWAYNDQGMQWGRIVSCSTSTGFVTCRDKLCRTGHWSRPAGSNASIQFPTEPAAISDALAALAEE